MHRSPGQSGFTLIEIMIVVAIVAILASIALPTYRDYLRRGQLPEASTYLSDYRIKLEQYYQDNRAYSTDGTCGTGATWSSFAPTEAKYFAFSCATAAPYQTYTLTATGSKGQAVGHTYTLTADGSKATTQYKGAATSKACWLMSGSEC